MSIVTSRGAPSQRERPEYKRPKVRTSIDILSRITRTLGKRRGDSLTYTVNPKPPVICEGVSKHSLHRW